MWVELTVYGGFLVGSYVYHRWVADQPPKPKPAQQIEIPRVDQGASIPLVYGRCRVRAPILAWAGSPSAVTTATPGLFNYSMSMLMIVGIPFEGGNVSIGDVWVGETKLRSGPLKPNGSSYLVDNGGTPGETQQGLIGQAFEVLDGRASQTLVNPTAPFAATTAAGLQIKASGIDGSAIPGFRGYACVFHYGFGGGAGAKWALGFSPNLGAYQYEIATYPADSDAFNVGLEANPAKVIRDLLVGKFGKLNFPAAKIDGVTFGAAKVRLQEEGNGYSRAIENAPDANAVIQEICRQIDAVVYEDPYDGLIKIKLIRGDYDVNALLGVTTENCVRLENFAAGSFENVVNKVRVIFTNRGDGYRDGSASAHNQATAAGQDGDVREALIHMPGVCTQQLANELAARELAARSRPIAKCRAIVDRTFHRVRPGDPVRVTWPEYGIDGRVFRVANIGFGALENGGISLDLIEDFFYVWRNVVIPTHPIEPFPGGGGVLEEP